MRALRQNVGSFDRWLRLSVGFVLLLLAGTGVIGAWGYILSVLPLATGMVSYCPLYHALRIRAAHGHRGKH